MYETTLKIIRQAYSGESAKRHVAHISQHHRIQASPGYREAARYVQAQLSGAGLCTEMLSFPADQQTAFWTMESFQEWACARATLDLMQGGQAVERLCDFQAEPISVIQRSAPANGVFGVVALADGTEDAHYDGLDVAGKLVLTDGDVVRVYDLAVRRRGAAGILFDGMSPSAPGRSPLDLPDARQYTSFWWGKEEPRCFGFVLTPRQGRQLRHEAPLQVRAHVVSTSHDGAFEVVTAFIPGLSDQEALVVAHLCHPQPSANDNASGAAAAVEIACTLHRLINDGLLPLPRRGIRFLWMPEMTGTYAYLATYPERLPRTVAGINLDMVGQDQGRCHSTFNIEQPPEALASFAPVLVKRLWDMLLAAEEGQAPETTGALRHAVTPFSGGSDHIILSDPTVGVPTPLLIQWPDRFYHTSEDTLDKVDPAMLARVGSLAAAYAYAVASAGRREAIWLGHEIVARRQQRLTERTQNAIVAALAAETSEDLARLWAEVRDAVSHRIARDKQALASLARLWPDSNGLIDELSGWLDHSAARELRRVETVCREQARGLGYDQLPALAADEPAPWRLRAAQLRPTRRYRGPVAFRSLLDGGDCAERDALWAASRRLSRAGSTACTLAEYWADGQRSVAQIADLVRHETGRDYGPEILAYFELLANKGLVEWQP